MTVLRESEFIDGGATNDEYFINSVIRGKTLERNSEFIAHLHILVIHTF